MSLLKLTVENKKVSLPDDFVLRLLLQMPLPYKENIPAGITQWFTFKSNRVNDPIFKHANFIYAVDKLKIYTCILEVSGRQMKGKLYLKSSEYLDYKAFIVFNDLIEELSKKKVADVVDYSYYMGADATEIIAEMERLQALNFPSANYGFPTILNSKFFEAGLGNYSGRPNKWDFEGGQYNINYYYAPDDEEFNVTAMVPQPYLLHVIQEMFKAVDFIITGSVISNANFRKLLLYSNYAEQHFTKTNYFLGTEYASSFAVNGAQNGIDIDTEFEDDDNCFNSSQNTYQSAFDGDFVIKFRAEGTYNGSNPTGATFSVYVRDGVAVVGQVVTTVLTNGVTDYIEGFTVVTASFPTFTFFMTSQNVDSSGTVNITNIELEVYPKVNQRVDIFGSIFELKNHVPEITVSEFLNAIARKFCLAVFFDFDNKVVEFKSWNEILLNQEYIDLTTKLIEKSTKISFEQKAFSIITSWDGDELADKNFLDSENEIISNQILQNYPAPSGKGQFLVIVPANLIHISDLSDTGTIVWKFYSDNFKDVKNENIEAEPLDIIISTLFFREDTDSAKIYHPEVVKIFFKTYYPAIEQSGGSKLLGKNDSGFKVYNNHGFQAIDAYQIPFASNSNKDFAGNDIGGFNFNMVAEDGLYNEMHKALYDYINGRNQVEIDFDIDNDTFLKLIDLFLAGKSTRKVRVGSKNYLPEQVDISIGLNNFKNCKITMR